MGHLIRQVQEKISAFYLRLQATSSRYFALDPCKANEQWVSEFYTNLKAINLSNLVMNIMGMVVRFGFEVINGLYRLPDADLREFEAKNYAQRAD